MNSRVESKSSSTPLMISGEFPETNILFSSKLDIATVESKVRHKPRGHYILIQSKSQKGAITVIRKDDKEVVVRTRYILTENLGWQDCSDIAPFLTEDGRKKYGDIITNPNNSEYNKDQFNKFLQKLAEAKMTSIIIPSPEEAAPKNTADSVYCSLFFARAVLSKPREPDVKDDNLFVIPSKAGGEVMALRLTSLVFNCKLSSQQRLEMLKQAEKGTVLLITSQSQPDSVTMHYLSEPSLTGEVGLAYQRYVYTERGGWITQYQLEAISPEARDFLFHSKKVPWVDDVPPHIFGLYERVKHYTLLLPPKGWEDDRFTPVWRWTTTPSTTAGPAIARTLSQKA